MKTEKQHLYTLDFLRGIAALFVVLFHYSSTGLSKIMVESTRQLFSWGYLGVEIFFVISGFIIPYVLNKSNYKISDFGGFIGKRFVRICPPSYIVLLLTILQFFAIDYFKLSQNKWFGALTIPQIFHNFTYTVPFTDYLWLNGVFWTLAVEFQFYIIIGLVYTFMFKNLKYFIFIVLIITSIFYTPIAQPIQFFHYGTLFIIGTITLLFFEKKISVLNYSLLISFFGLLCFFQLGILPALFGVATSLIISFVQIKNRLSEFLGKISYSLYLTHILVGSSLEAFLIKVFPPDTPFIKTSLLILIFVLAIAGAYLFHRMIEVYFINLANRLFSQRKLAKQVVA